MAKARKKENLTLEEKLKQALVPVEEQPYEVPGNWCWCRISVVSEFERGITFPASAKEYRVTEYNIPCIRTANIQDNLEITDVFYIDKKFLKGNVAKLLRIGDIIMSSANSRELVGKTVYVSGLPCPMTFGGFVLTIRAKSIQNKYLFYFLKLEFLFGSFMEEATQTTNIANINTTKLGNYIFPLPPLAEQQRVVEQIERLFFKLDKAKKKVQEVIDSIEIRKATILDKAFKGELTEVWREQNNIELDSWGTILFKDLIVEGPQNGIYKEKSAYGYGTKILRIDCFYNGYLEPWGKLKRVSLSNEEIELYKLKVNDIVINRVNSMPYLGKSALIRELPEVCVYESNMMKVKLDAGKVFPEYIIKFLNSPIGLQELRKNAKQAVNQASINQKDVKNVVVTLPPIEEQKEIVNILERLKKGEKAAKGKIEYVLERIDLIKKSILTKAFRGELGTNNPEEESSVELLKQILEEM